MKSVKHENLLILFVILFAHTPEVTTTLAPKFGSYQIYYNAIRSLDSFGVNFSKQASFPSLFGMPVMDVSC